MKTFVDLHAESIVGVIAMFDRLILKGHLNGFYPEGAFGRYLSWCGILLKDAGGFFEAQTARLCDHVTALAATAGRPLQYLAQAHTHASGSSKEDLARQIAERDGVTEGLVCVLSAVEPCRSFAVIGDRATRRLRVVRRSRKCLHYYLYLIDPEFGWMPVRLQTWAPYQIQAYVNGREWLARQLDALGIGYRRSGNKITHVDDLAKVEDLCRQFARTDWPRFLERQAALVNPLLGDIAGAGFGGYWWVIDQSEYATDILFKSRQALEAIHADLVKTAVTGFDATTDVMHFLGRKPHHAFAGEATIDSKQRHQGCRIRFRLKANAIKLYDHANVLRVETTINNPQEFKVLRSAGTGEPQTLRWSPMRKGVANFWRYAEVAHAANGRLLNALARAPLTGSATAELGSLCQGRVVNGRRIPALNPVHPDLAILFAAALAGEFTINGFRNRDLQAKPYRDAAHDPVDARRRTHRVSRLVAKLRAHGLIAKVKDNRLYRVTARGIKAMWPAIRFARSTSPPPTAPHKLPRSCQFLKRNCIQHFDPTVCSSPTDY